MKDLVFTAMPLAQKWWLRLMVGLLFVSLGFWMFIPLLPGDVFLTIFLSFALATAGAIELVTYAVNQERMPHLRPVPARRQF